MITAFWEVPGFFQAAGALVLFAAAAALAITYGPGEEPQPEPGPDLPTMEADTIYAWELTLAEWNVLSPEGRAFYRDNITKAPRFAEILR
ncbi:hypothetical protein [Arthrobacter sp. C152]